MEETIGITAYLVKTPGIGGRLRVSPEDFVVDEIPLPIKPKEGGEYTVASIRSRNWETNRLVRRLARNLGISRKRIRFAGTKDKRAVTTQFFQFDLPAEEVESLRIPDVEILEVFETDERLEIGHLLGNSFRIAVKETNIPVKEAFELCCEVRDELLGYGGFPNFFGVQRFGALRPVTHLVGRHIVRRDFREAVLTYVANPFEAEPEEALEARKRLQEEMDFSEALKYYPDRLSFEKALLNHLAKKGDDFVGAMLQLPDNLLLMFVHAYQSHLFNRMLSERMRKGLPINEPLVGDFVLPLNSLGLPDHNRSILVKKQNLEKITNQVRRKKAFVSAPLFGQESNYSEGEMGDIERQVIQEEGLGRMDFLIPDIPRLSSKGTRREILAPLDAVEMDLQTEAIQLEFSLNKGCYATSLLREFMKTNAMRY